MFRPICRNLLRRRSRSSAREQRSFSTCHATANGWKLTASPFSAGNATKCPRSIHVRAVWHWTKESRQQRTLRLIVAARDELALKNAVLVTVPLPQEFEIDRSELESILADALNLADEKGIKGKEITPFLLSQMSERSGGRTSRRKHRSPRKQRPRRGTNC